MTIERVTFKNFRNIKVLCFTCGEMSDKGGRFYEVLGEFPNQTEGSFEKAEGLALQHELHNPSHVIVIGLVNLLGYG